MSSGRSKWNASWNVWNNNQTTNYNKALNEYNQRVADEINNYYTTNSPSKYYFRGADANNEYNNVVNSMLTNDKKNLQNYLDQNFTGLGGSNTWLNNYYTGNEFNNQTAGLINDQYNSALEQLNRAAGRGFLNDAGYNNALNNLNKQKSAAQTTIGDIGKGIIDDYKADLTNKAQGYLTDIDNYNLNQYDTINTNNWNQDFNNLYNQQKEGMQSRFDLATNGLNLFDTSDLIGNARLTQGVTNQQNDNLYNAIDEQNQKKNKQYGLGNVGLF